MEFIEQLKNLQLFKPGMDILDVGCNNAWLFQRLNKPGRNFDLIDIVNNVDSDIKNQSNVRFFQESFTEFEPDKKYDLIFAKDTFFHHSDQIGQAVRYMNYLKPNGVACIAFMLEDDPHVGRRAIDGSAWFGVSQEIIDSFLKNYEVLWKKDFDGEYLNMAEKLVVWHVQYFILRNKQ